MLIQSMAVLSAFVKVTALGQLSQMMWVVDKPITYGSHQATSRSIDSRVIDVQYARDDRPYIVLISWIRLA